MSDWMNDPEAEAWADEVLDDLLPRMRASEAVISLVPNGPSDIKFAVEIGLALLLDKPIILAVQPGVTVPSKLVKVADRIVEFSMDDGQAAERFARAVAEVLERD